MGNLSLRVLEARSQKSRQGHAPFKCSKGVSTLCLSLSFLCYWQLLVFPLSPPSRGILSVCPTSSFLCRYLSPCIFSSHRTIVILDKESTLLQYDLILTYILIHLQRSYVQIRSYSQVPRIKTSTSFGETQSYPQQRSFIFTLLMIADSWFCKMEAIISLLELNEYIKCIFRQILFKVLINNQNSFLSSFSWLWSSMKIFSIKYLQNINQFKSGLNENGSSFSPLGMLIPLCYTISPLFTCLWEYVHSGTDLFNLMFH